jgi:hypothetical protein
MVLRANESNKSDNSPACTVNIEETMLPDWKKYPDAGKER